MKPIGSKTKYGMVVAIGFVGERYYWIRKRDGVVSLFPAFMIEQEQP